MMEKTVDAAGEMMRASPGPLALYIILSVAMSMPRAIRLAVTVAVALLER
jgi:hypothetical protein